MVAAARRKTGHSDLGHPSFEAGLRLLLEEADHNTKLTAFGRFVYHFYLPGFIHNRLRLEDVWKRHPEIFDQKIETPIVIVGLPRTGTTLLQRLLAADPQHQGLVYWQAQRPLAPKAIGKAGPDFRRLYTRFLIWLSRLISPSLRSIHELRIEGPEECLHMMNSTFLSWLFLVQGNVPRWREQLESIDLTPLYRDHKRQLQTLQWQSENRQRWVLKSPGHMIGLPAMISTYPDIRVIETTREPEIAVPSTCSLTLATRHFAASEIDLHALGHDVTNHLEVSWRRAQTALTDLPKNQQFHLPFDTLVSDPIAAVKAIYKHFGLECSEVGEAAMQSILDENPRHKHGRHDYDAETFGLNESELRSRFS